MPIKDLSNRGRTPRLGKIRLGIRQGPPQTKNAFPKAVDYFVCPEEVRAVYGDKPKKLKILFHSDNLEEVFPQYYKRYGKSTGLVCKGDGELAVEVTPGTGELKELECQGRECDYYQKKVCKHVGNLSFMIRGVNRFGVYQLDTSSINTILNINGGIEYAKKLTQGRLALVPFILEIVPQDVSPEGKKKTVWVLRLEADMDAMMKSLDQTPQAILTIDPLRNPGMQIEGDLFDEDIVKTLKPLPSELNELWAEAGKRKITADQLHTAMEKGFGIDSSKDITRNQFEKLKDFVITGKKIEPEITAKDNTGNKTKATGVNLNGINTK